MVHGIIYGLYLSQSPHGKAISTSATRSTAEVAQALGVSITTIQNWSFQFAPYLSEAARPGPGLERRFTEQDVNLLAYIKQLRNDGLQAKQIRLRLAEQVTEAYRTQP